MKILLATDIFGITDAVKILSERLNSVCESVQIIDPYAGKQMNFYNEEEAYNTFNRLCGLENHITFCSQALDLHSCKEMILIGFSMGASSLWKALDGRTNPNIKGFYGFYTSQIRHFLDAKIHLPCTLVFPTHEKHFDVDNVIAILDQNEHVTCFKVAYLHGFMNPCSINYDTKGYEEYSRWIEEKIELFYPRTAFNQL